MSIQRRRGSALKRYLEAKLESAAEAYERGEISRGEVFRHEVDISVQKDSGPILFLSKGKGGT